MSEESSFAASQGSEERARLVVPGSLRAGCFSVGKIEGIRKGVSHCGSAIFETRMGLKNERTQDVQGRRRHTCRVGE